MSTPQTCPVCLGSQSVAAALYGEGGDAKVPCRSCKASGVVWPQQVVGDLIVHGDIVASGHCREWCQPQSTDVVSGLVGSDILTLSSADWEAHERFSALDDDEREFLDTVFDLGGEATLTPHHDVPSLTLTPGSVAELEAASDFIARLERGPLRTAVESLVTAMREHAAKTFGDKIPDQP